MKRAAHGFTLLETLVALAILGVVLTTVFSVIGGGLRTAQRDEDRVLLALMAQNLMVRSRLDLVPTNGPLSGTIEGGLRWRIESEPYRVPPPVVTELREGRDGNDREANGERSLGERLKEHFGSSDDEDEGTGRSARFGRQADEAAGENETSGDAGPRFGRSESDSSESGNERPRRPRDEVRLRLVRVTVEKGRESFVLTGLAVEPRRERNRFR